jgi:hypothetical protein
MDFRWLIFLTLWTMLSGPVLARPIIGQESAATAKPTSHSTR